ncbi:hypothetical protein NDU88_000109 [Pleurodeles waltl]|uniref:Uncharacterized protein n=1 Tax=Pleurodeles waltl TaxID=8319 RepID=A0AAV7SVE0_PLEWA|nr:hypothetical protein NDU88_000109 [Pleurodeles waltl]
MEAAKALLIGLVGAIQSAAAVMRPGDSSEARPAAQEGPQAATARAQTGGDTARARGHAHSGNCFRTPRAPEATHRCCKKPGPGDRSVAAGAASAAADPEVIPLPGQRGGSEAYLRGRHLRLKHHYIGMGRTQAPGKKVKVQWSPQSVRATLPSSPVHDVSASRSQNNAQMDLKLESLSENLSHIILLSMLEQLEAKLDDLQNTLKDVPSRVAGLMEQIWIAKSQYPLPNGGVSLEMVCPMSIRDCAVSQSPATPQLDRPGEASMCLQPVFTDRHVPKQDCTLSSPTDVKVSPYEPRLYLLPVLPDRCDPLQGRSMQPGFPDVREPQEDQCMQPGFPDVHELQHDQCMQPGFPDGNELKQDCTESRCPQTDPSLRSLEGKLCLQQEFADEQTPQQDHSIQPAIPEEKEPDEHLKQEPSPLSANSWNQQQNVCPGPLFAAGDEPQQDHCKEPVLPNAKEPDEQVGEELMCFDCQDPQENQCLQPGSHDGKAPCKHLQSGLLSLDIFGSQQTQCLQLAFQDTQQHLCLKQEFPCAQDPNVDYELESLHQELESMHPEAQEPNQNYKVEPLHPVEQDSYQNDKLEPPCTDAQGSYQNDKLEPPYTDTQGSYQNDKLEPPCTDAQGSYQNDKLEPPCTDARGSYQNDKLEPPCTDARGSYQNDKLEPLRTDARGSYQNDKLEPPCTDAQGSYQNEKLEPPCTDARGSYQNDKLEPPCTDARGAYQNDKLQPPCTDAQGSYQNDKLQPPCSDAQGSYQNDKLQPPCSDAQGSDRNSVLEPLLPESKDQHQNYKLELLCSDERGPSVPPSCLELDTSTADQDALTVSIERGNTKSHLLLFEGFPGGARRGAARQRGRREPEEKKTPTPRMPECPETGLVVSVRERFQGQQASIN